MRFRPAIWLANTLRNRLQNTLMGGLIRHLRRAAPVARVRVVSASRSSEAEFWKKSALGRSLSIWRSNPLLEFHIQYENTAGLPSVYNAQLRAAGPGDILIFVHDDIWLDDPQWLDKVQVALKRFDVVGVAGSVKRAKDQQAWCFIDRDVVVQDGRDHQGSGAMGHGMRPAGAVAVYGPTPARCKLLDGAFLALRQDVAARSGLWFDEQFNFHFYDLDLCRSATKIGMSLGTWPIALTHQSVGAFRSPGWEAGLALYRRKWKS